MGEGIGGMREKRGGGGRERRGKEMTGGVREGRRGKRPKENNKTK